MVKRKLINGDHDLSKPGICLVLRNFKYRQLSYPIDIKEKIKSKFERKEGINVSKSCRKVFLKLLELNDEIELSKKDEYKDIHIKFEEAWNLLEEKVIEKGIKKYKKEIEEEQKKRFYDSGISKFSILSFIIGKELGVY